MQNSKKQTINVLALKFERQRAKKVLKYFNEASTKYLEEKWEGSLEQSGKFIEAVIKMLWVQAGKQIANHRNFSVGTTANSFLNGQVTKKDLPDENLRLVIPRSILLIYDITSNRGGRHDSDIYEPNKVDAQMILPICAWILVELIRYSDSDVPTTEEIKATIESIVSEKVPFFEKIDDRIYVNKKTKSANECALLILYSVYPNRLTKQQLTDCVTLHPYKKNALHLERMTQYIDVDSKNRILLRTPGRQEAENILRRKK